MRPAAFGFILKTLRHFLPLKFLAQHYGNVLSFLLFFFSLAQSSFLLPHLFFIVTFLAEAVYVLGSFFQKIRRCSMAGEIFPSSFGKADYPFFGNFWPGPNPLFFMLALHSLGGIASLLLPNF